LRYSGSRNRYGMPRYFPKLPVTIANKMIQHNIKIWFRWILFKNNCTGNEKAIFGAKK
jgi:hypothetical protein